MTAEQLFWAWCKAEILSPKRLVYRSNSYYYDAIQGRNAYEETQTEEAQP